MRNLDKAMKYWHENDAISVGRLVEELGTKVVIGYKPQGVVKEAFPKLTEESFLLVIMTDFQAKMFEKHRKGKRGVATAQDALLQTVVCVCTVET